jgi:hypothetical protein
MSLFGGHKVLCPYEYVNKIRDSSMFFLESRTPGTHKGRPYGLFKTKIASRSDSTIIHYSFLIIN